MTGRDQEYDRFGPWVVEIGDEDPWPRLFVPHLTRTEQALISVKIPRKIARRDAHPGMDLYDYVVSLYEDDMVILERDGGEVRSKTIAYAEVKHLAISEELLRGGLHLGVPGGPYDLPYNTVSNELVRRVADLIRSRYHSPPLTPAGTRPHLPTTSEPPGLSFYFEHLLRDERQQGSAMQLLVAQPATALGSVASGALHRLILGIIDKRLLESLHSSDGRELRVVDRGQPIAYRWHAVYGRRETHIPLANITGVAWDEGADDRATATLTVSTAGGDSRWVFTRDNAGVGAYRDWLAALP